MKPRLIALTVACWLTATGPLPAQCLDNGADHQRQAFKNRPAPSPIPTVAPITVADALAWPVIVVSSFNDTDPIGAEELQVIHLRAFVRAFKCEADGDYHLEVADSGASTARRVIVEAPPSQPAVRAQLEQLLDGPPPSDKPRTFNGSKAVPLDFLGWRFFDVSHQLKPVDAHTHQKRTLAQIKKGQ